MSHEAQVSLEVLGVEISVGEFDTQDGVKLGLDGEHFWRTHLTPQGEILTGDGGSAPTPLADEFTPTNGNSLSAAISTIPRTSITTNNLAAASGSLRLCFFTAPVSETYSGVRVLSGTVAAAATPTLVRFGVYREEANGDVTLIASTPNDTSLLAAASTRYSKALSAPVTLERGARYAFASLVVSATTMPSWPGNAPGSGLTTSFNAEFGESPRLAANVTGQTDLPASVAEASISDTTTMWYSVLTV